MPFPLPLVPLISGLIAGIVAIQIGGWLLHYSPAKIALWQIACMLFIKIVRDAKPAATAQQRVLPEQDFYLIEASSYEVVLTDMRIAGQEHRFRSSVQGERSKFERYAFADYAVGKVVYDQMEANWIQSTDSDDTSEYETKTFVVPALSKVAALEQAILQSALLCKTPAADVSARRMRAQEVLLQREVYAAMTA